MINLTFVLVISLFRLFTPLPPSIPVPSSSHQIITALEEDTTAQKMQLGYRLQQIAAAVENKVTDLWQRKYPPEPWQTEWVGSRRWFERLAPCRWNWKAGAQQTNGKIVPTFLSGGRAGAEEPWVFEETFFNTKDQKIRVGIEVHVPAPTDLSERWLRMHLWFRSRTARGQRSNLDKERGGCAKDTSQLRCPSVNFMKRRLEERLFYLYRTCAGLQTLPSYTAALV